MMSERDIKELADLVAGGKLSRRRVERLHGKDARLAVTAELAARQAVARAARLAAPRANPLPVDGPAQADGLVLCSACARILHDEDGDDLDAALCCRCSGLAARGRWLDEAEARVIALAVRHGWAVGDRSYAAETGSRYIEIFRPTGEDDEESLKVRLSDHGVLYDADVSIVMPGRETPDDDDWPALERRLETRP